VRGYRRVNGYGFEKGRSPFFLEKTCCTRTRLSTAPTRTRRPVKFKFQKFPPRFTSDQYPYPPKKKQKQKKKQKTETEKKIEKKNKNRKKIKTEKKYPRTRTRRTRARGTRVPETGTGMKQVGYNFEKKNVYPCPLYPSTHRARARPTRRPPRSYLAHARGTR
jgi:hypothetical protein